MLTVAIRNADLFSDHIAIDPVIPVRPKALAHEEWPPDYPGVYAWRLRTIAGLEADPDLLESAMAYYADRPDEFIQHWMDTFDPRKVTGKWMPFVFFARQSEMVQFLEDCRTTSRSGLMEKCRDAGATWLSCAYSVWAFLFIDDMSIGWGSRKESLVDKLGDADSIFEKMRLLLSRLPRIFMPKAWRPREHATYMKLINPNNGATISGEAGDNIGRGGRSSIYFVDEAAHIERPEKIEAALGDNTNVRIDISSVNGLGNPFHRTRESGYDWYPGHDAPSNATLVFIMDWSHHPAKTQEWYDARKAKAVHQGMQHIFAQEVDRDYSAAISNTIITFEWIQSAVDAHLHIPYLAEIVPPDAWTAGLDVADEGEDRNALTKRQWIILRSCEEWGERDVGVTCRRVLAACRQHRGIKVQYDCIGIGAGVKSEYNRLIDDATISEADLRMVPWNAGAGVVRPYERVIPDDDLTPLNRDMFGNFKAQAWFDVSRRFYKTHRARKEGVIYDPEELISLDSRNPLLHQLMKELAQPTKGESTGLRMIVNKKPNGMKSPNLADSAIEAFFPAPDDGGHALVGSYGGSISKN